MSDAHDLKALAQQIRTAEDQRTLLELAEALERLSAERPGTWQPIETAPKDGREVLLRVKMRAGVPNGHLVGHYMSGGHCIEDHPPIDGGWYFWNGLMFDNRAEPTHWMPLPQHEPKPDPTPEESGR